MNSDKIGVVVNKGCVGGDECLGYYVEIYVYRGLNVFWRDKYIGWNLYEKIVGRKLLVNVFFYYVVKVFIEFRV